MHKGRLIGFDTPSGLKSQLPKGTIWQLTVEGSSDLIEELERQQLVRTASLSAGSIRLHTNEKSNAQQIQTLLGEGILETESIQPLEGNLEDVFLWLAQAD
jgi:ABC-type multidrug transport system ATPase subunit